MNRVKPAAKADNDGVIEASPPRRQRRRIFIVFDHAQDRAQQQFKDESDINVIMARYLKTGVLPAETRQPVYLDTTAYDFIEAQELVARARGEFSLLSAEERDSYGNSVEAWLDAKALEAAEAEEASRPVQVASVAPEPSTPSTEAPAKRDPAAASTAAKRDPAAAPTAPPKGG